MDPVVVGRSLERLTWDNWAAFVLLLQAVFFLSLIHKLLLQPFFLPLSVSLLLVGYLRWLVELLICDFVRTKYAFIVL